MYITVCPSLPPLQWLRRNADNLFAMVPDGRWLRYGRDALHAGLCLLGLRRGDVVLMPASMCDAVLRAFVHEGIGIRYYALDPTLQPDLADLESRICPATRAVYANHYFGIPIDMSTLRDRCRARGLALIEDAAHTLPYAGSSVGRYGDIALFSPRKLLPLPHGGLLLINNDVSTNFASLPKAGEAMALLAMLKLVAADFARLGLLPVASFKHWRGSIEDYLSASASLQAEDWKPPQRMSSLSLLLAAHCSIGDLARQRQQHYEAWARWCETESSVTAFAPELPVPAIPFSFPLRVNDGRRFIRAAARLGIYLEPTLTAPQRKVPGLLNPEQVFPMIETLATQLVSLPIHQSLQPRQMRVMQSALKEACRSQV